MFFKSRHSFVIYSELLISLKVGDFLNKTPIGTSRILLVKVIGEKVLRKLRKFKWLKRSKEFREFVEDDQTLNRPPTALILENLDKVFELIVPSGQTLSLHYLAETVSCGQKLDATRIPRTGLARPSTVRLLHIFKDRN